MFFGASMGQNSSERVWLQRLWDRELCKSIAQELQLPVSIVSILMQRDLCQPDAINSFLNPALSELPSPFLMKGMEESVEILLDARARGKKVVIYGDYDADGVTATAVLCLFLAEIGMAVSWCQPNRIIDGYGLQEKILSRLVTEAQDGVLITVDCGISNVVEVERARNMGFTVIVTDHHQPPSKLPPAHSVLNPLQNGCQFPFKHLAGVGVAFYLIMGLRSRLVRDGFWPDPGVIPNLKNYLDLVAIGTVTDLVPLVGPNRIIVQAGLEIMRNGVRPGLKCLAQVAGIDSQYLSTEDISFRLGPRINAAGRVGAADKAIDLLMTPDPTQAFQLAVSLDNDNRLRREIGQELYQEAVAIGSKQYRQGRRTLVVVGEQWHAGVLGVVASRLAEFFFRPTILMSLRDDGLVKGSGRSIPGVNLYEMLNSRADLLEEFGGHKMAVGVTVRHENITEFVNVLEDIASQLVHPSDLTPKLYIDWQAIGAELFDDRFLTQYSRLPPFGIGNHEPIFVIQTKDFGVDGVSNVGRNHLKLSFRHNGVIRHGIGFGLGHHSARIRDENSHLAFCLRQNEFRGIRRWELNVSDVQFGQNIFFDVLGYT